MDFQNMPPPLTLLIHVLYKYLLRASRCSFGFFAAELVAGEGDAGRPASCLAVMRSCWQIGLGVLVPAGPLSWGFLSAFSSVGSLQAPSSCLYCNYSTVKCTLLANCDTGEFGNPHSYVYSTNKC